MLITVDCVCPLCHKVTSVVVDENDYLDWKNGKLAQDAFWYLDADERELLISGLCLSCWSDLFRDEQEEEDSPEWHDTCDQEEEEEEWYEDDFLEVGFNPYLGDYDFDC